MTKERDKLKCLEVRLKDALMKADDDAKISLSKSSLKESIENSLLSKKKLDDNFPTCKGELMNTFD